MSDDADRSRLAAELKRAFSSATTPPAAALVLAENAPAGGSISFTMPLLKAVIAGRKTETRRPIRPSPARVVDGVPLRAEGEPIPSLAQVGERLWIREKWARVVDEAGERFALAADEPSLGVRWKSSRFMPRAAARRALLITSVDVARLSEIDEPAAEREGADPLAAMHGARAWFMSAWDAIYGETEFAAASDPWVWILRFELESVTP